MNLDASQLVILGVIASVLVQISRWLISQVGKETGRIANTAIVVVISLGLSYFWNRPELPSIGENPLEFATQMLEVASGVVGFSVVIYNWLLKRVYSGVSNAFTWASGN